MPTDRQARGGASGGTDLPGSFLAELRALLAQGRRIEAIQRYRFMTGADLPAARMAIEKIGRGNARLSLDGLVRLLAAFLWLCAILAAIASGWQAYDRHVVNTTWPQTDAEVVKCSVVTHATRSPSFSTLVCQFRYDVGNVAYTAKTSSTGIPSAEQEAAMHKWVARHRPGSRQAIHYDPSDPQRISLGDADASFQADTPAQRLRLAGLFAGGGVLFVAIAAWLSARRQGRADESSDSSL